MKQTWSISTLRVGGLYKAVSQSQHSSQIFLHTDVTGTDDDRVGSHMHPRIGTDSEFVQLGFVFMFLERHEVEKFWIKILMADKIRWLFCSGILFEVVDGT